MTFRIFTNDRRDRCGIPMYSCRYETEASTPEDAVASIGDDFFGPPHFAPIKAIEWPPTTEASKKWLANYT